MQASFVQRYLKKDVIRVKTKGQLGSVGGKFNSVHLELWFSFSEVKIVFEMLHCVNVETAGTVCCC